MWKITLADFHRWLGHVTSSTNEREAEGKCITSERKWGNLGTIPGFLLSFCRDPGGHFITRAA